MKYLLLPVLLFFSASLHAQTFQLGLNAGFVRTGVHNYDQGNTWEDADRYQSQVISPDVSVKTMYVHKNYQFGIALDYRSLSYKSDYFFLPSARAELTELQFNDHQIPLKIFVNRAKEFKHVEVYGGVSIGYVFINSQSKTVFKTIGQSGNDSTEYFKNPTQHPNSIVGSLQIGATYFVTKRIGINIEMTGEYINYPAINKYAAYPDFLGTNILDKGNLSFPATIGVRYRL